MNILEVLSRVWYFLIDMFKDLLLNMVFLIEDYDLAGLVVGRKKKKKRRGLNTTM